MALRAKSDTYRDVLMCRLSNQKQAHTLSESMSVICVLSYSFVRACEQSLHSLYPLRHALIGFKSFYLTDDYNL